MNDHRLDGMRVAILVTDDFEQVEMTEPRKALKAAGADTVLLAPHSGEVQGFHHDEKGDKFHVDMAIDDANPQDFDAVMLPGGALNADRLRMEQSARDFVREMEREGKPVAAICHAPWLLVSAGLVQGRTLTSFYTLQDDIRNAGATWQDRPVVRDHNWVTSRQPKDIPAFDEAMIELFGEYAGEHAHRESAVMGAGQSDHPQPQSGKPGGGQGRTDQVGGSGVYPASDQNAPEDAQAHGEASWGQGSRGAAGYYDHGTSELHVDPEDQDDESQPRKRGHQQK